LVSEGSGAGKVKGVPQVASDGEVVDERPRRQAGQGSARVSEAAGGQRAQRDEAAHAHVDRSRDQLGAVAERPASVAAAEEDHDRVLLLLPLVRHAPLALD